MHAVKKGARQRCVNYKSLPLEIFHSFLLEPAEFGAVQ